MPKAIKLIRAASRYITDSRYRFILNANFGLYDKMPDKEYLQKLFFAKMGVPLNLDNPKTFNEKLQWLKLYNRKPEYTMMVDKYLVRQYIAEKLGETYLIPLLGVWNSSNDIDFEALPNQFVLKCNHNSGLGMCICRDKSLLNYDKVKEQLEKGLKQNYYFYGREWPYANVPRKIIAEKYMVDTNQCDLADYKVFCFDGKPEYIFVHTGRFHQHRQTVFDTKWKRLNITQAKDYGAPPAEYEISEPTCLREMLELSERLSQGIPHIRADWYIIQGKLLFGELTFFDGSGFSGFDNPEDDLLIGGKIKLPKKLGL